MPHQPSAEWSAVFVLRTGAAQTWAVKTSTHCSLPPAKVNFFQLERPSLGARRYLGLYGSFGPWPLCRDWQWVCQLEPAVLVAFVLWTSVPWKWIVSYIHFTDHWRDIRRPELLVTIGLDRTEEWRFLVKDAVLPRLFTLNTTFLWFPRDDTGRVAESGSPHFLPLILTNR